MILGHSKNQPVSGSDRENTAVEKQMTDSWNQRHVKKIKKISVDTGTNITLWDQQWPPQGWPMFETVKQQKAISTRKCPDTKIITGTSYQIALHKISNKITSYTLEIQEWAYGQNGQHRISTPIMLRFKNCPQNSASDHKAYPCFEAMRLLGDVKTPKNETETNNFALVTAYLISRIEKGFVPDVKRMLKLYKLI